MSVGAKGHDSPDLAAIEELKGAFFLHTHIWSLGVYCMYQYVYTVYAQYCMSIMHD